jgi:lysozyme family protein
MASITDDARSQLLIAMSVLMQRRADTQDPAEKAVITASLKEMKVELDRLEQAELLDAAASVADASDALERAIGAAKLRPFDNFLTAAEESLRRLGQIGGEMHFRESLPSAEDEIVPPPAVAPPPGAPPVSPPSAAGTPSAPPAAPPDATPPAARQLPPLSTSTAFADAATQCEAWYAKCKVRPERASNVEFYGSRLLKFKPTYVAVGEELNGIPWQLIGIAHGMEAGFDFSRHLHNGDPLTDRTKQVPAGRPATGKPPFTWRASAVDALMLKGLHQVAKWSLARVLYELERFNGFGYRLRALPSPYLWSFTDLYVKGKYVRDHEFDPDAVSKQCGAAAILKGLEAKGEGIRTGGTTSSVTS